MISQPISSVEDLLGAPEAELVARARRRDDAAIRELVRRLNPLLFRVARGRVQTDAEAEEVVQDAYLSAFTHLDTFRGDARFATWMTRIALNAAGMRVRRYRPHEEYDTVTDDRSENSDVVAFPTRPHSPEATLGRAQARGFLEDAVGALPPDLRVVFLLRETEGLSILAIARDLGLNPVTVKTRLFRARRRLRALLEDRLNGGFESVFPFDGARCAGMADRVITALRQQDAP